jgi:glycosyltransferase 2 family protein
MLNIQENQNIEIIEGPVPSAFCRHPKSGMEYLQIQVFRNIKWLTNVKIPFKIDFESVVTELILQHAKNFFIVGCNYTNYKYLADRGYRGIRIGKEAILDLNFNHFQKQSLKELIRRGKKNGQVNEILYSEDAAAQLDEFRKVSRHGKEPQLKYLFNSKFEDCNRLFVLRSLNGVWLGAILLSYKSDKYVQCEAILKRKNAPTGVMEALIYGIFNQLKKESIDYLTLGAVPFTIHDSKFLSKEYLINVDGRLLRFAYNYKGLFSFKNKFNPFWSDYYVCIRPSFSFFAMFGILLKSNLFKLAIHKLLHFGRSN